MTPRNHVRVTRTPNTVVTLFLQDRRAIKNFKISLFGLNFFFLSGSNNSTSSDVTFQVAKVVCVCVCVCARVCASHKYNAQPFLNSFTHLKEK